MGWFWADTNEQTAPTCPVTLKPASPGGAVCPVNHGQGQVPAPSAVSPPATSPVCPVKHDSKSSDSTVINPLNNMPYTISSEKAPGQKVNLSTERTFSTIPRGENEEEGVWEYPSPQQMLNAMLKKGKGDIPEDAVESMVDVHNWLNEAAWNEILEWEKPYIAETNKQPRLLKFIGKPQELSPRARMYLALSNVFPNTFNENPPFDRHDWTITRSELNGTQRQIRYVIDYYGGPDDEETGMPTFFLDVRPALDSMTNAIDRFKNWKQNVAEPLASKALGKN